LQQLDNWVFSRWDLAFIVNTASETKLDSTKLINYQTLSLSSITKHSSPPVSLIAETGGEVFWANKAGFYEVEYKLFVDSYLVPTYFLVFLYLK
jgi:endo-1,4-beta-D-glucanase Y